MPSKPAIHRRSAYRALPHRQRGAVSIMSAFLLIMLLTLLALVVDSGRLYYEKRSLQKIADMAALDTIARLPSANCSAAPAQALLFAQETATRNGLTNDGTTAITLECVDAESVAGLYQISTNPTSGMGVRVTASHTVPASLVIRGGALFSPAFNDNITLSASATAHRATPTAAFSVGSQLLRLDNSSLTGQLLAGIGLNPATLTVLDSSGLANVSITPSGLLQALGIEVSIPELKALSPEGLVQLIDTQVGALGIDQLLGISADLVGDATLAAELIALQQQVISIDILSAVDLRLLGLDSEDSGLLRLATGSAGDSAAALDANINLGELLSTALLVGTGDRGIEIPDLNLLGISVAAGVVEPPALAIGPVGTTAYTAQTRLYVDVDTNNIPVLSLLTQLLGTRIHLPIAIDLVSAQGTLDAINCSGPVPTADIHVESTILNACIGDVPDELRWSTSESCNAATTETELIRLLGLPVLSGKAVIPGLSHQDDLLGIAEGETQSTTPNSLALGDTVDGIVSALLDLLGGLFRPPTGDYGGDLSSDESVENQLIADLAAQYLEATKSSLGTYNVDNVTSLILNGSTELDENGEQVIPPLVNTDWFIENSIPTTCLLAVCPTSSWNDGTFSEAFHAYTSTPYGVLDLLGISTLGNGYYSCAGLLSSLLAWNSCVKNNLTLLLQRKPGGLDLEESSDIVSLLNPNTDTVNCSGILCLLLQPVLELVKPVLNGVGSLLTSTLDDVLGLELGRTDVTVESLSCGVPTLVQ